MTILDTPCLVKKSWCKVLQGLPQPPSPAAPAVFPMLRLLSRVVAIFRTWCKARRWARNMWLVAQLCPGRGTSPWLLLMRADFTPGTQTPDFLQLIRQQQYSVIAEKNAQARAACATFSNKLLPQWHKAWTRMFWRSKRGLALVCRVWAF